LRRVGERRVLAEKFGKVSSLHQFLNAHRLNDMVE
jgi:hypothetical protein